MFIGVHWWYNLTIFLNHIRKNIGTLFGKIYNNPHVALDNKPNNTQKIVDIVKHEIDYSDKYKDRLNPFSKCVRKFDDVPVASTWKHLTTCQLLEYTPLGNVLMYYDSEKDAFVYFSDRVLPYNYIDTVARRYVITYNCTLLYFDVNNKDSCMVLDTVVTNPLVDGEIQKNNKNSTDGVFVKFKSYNAPKTTVVKNVQHRINRYTYGGKLANFVFLKNPPPKKKFSYSEFKSKMKTK